MIFGFATDDGHERRIPICEEASIRKSIRTPFTSLTYLTAIHDCVNPTERIRTAFDVRITPDFLKVSEKRDISLSLHHCRVRTVRSSSLEQRAEPIKSSRFWQCLLRWDKMVPQSSNASKVITTWESSKHSRKSSFRPSFAAKVNGVKPELFWISVWAFFVGCRTACLNIS